MLCATGRGVAAGAVAAGAEGLPLRARLAPGASPSAAAAASAGAAPSPPLRTPGMLANSSSIDGMAAAIDKHGGRSGALYSGLNATSDDATCRSSFRPSLCDDMTTRGSGSTCVAIVTSLVGRLEDGAPQPAQLRNALPDVSHGGVLTRLARRAAQLARVPPLGQLVHAADVHDAVMQRSSKPRHIFLHREVALR